MNDLGLQRKLYLLRHLGGKCTKCGYQKNVAALVFHHKDGKKDKSFTLDVNNLSSTTWHMILKEVEKCELLCANCHAEVHNPELMNLI